jgi:hypothetical protein
MMGGEEYIVPPIPIGALIQLQSALEKISAENMLTQESIETIVKSAQVCMRRNYPDITTEQLEELIDVGNMHEVFAAIVDVSGLRRKAAEEKKRTAGNHTDGTT